MLARAVRFERDSWVSLARWARAGFRTPPPPAGAAAFGYHATVRPFLLTVLVVSVLEIAAVEFLLPWPTLRLVLLVVGVWSTVMVAGVLASVVVHPHTLDERHLRVRYGPRIEVRVPLAAVRSARRHVRDHPGATLRVAADEQRVSIGVGGQTTVTVELGEPVAVELPAGGTVRVRHVDLHADDPDALLAAVRARRRSPGVAGR